MMKTIEISSQYNDIMIKNTIHEALNNSRLLYSSISRQNIEIMFENIYSQFSNDFSSYQHRYLIQSDVGGGKTSLLRILQEILKNHGECLFIDGKQSKLHNKLVMMNKSMYSYHELLQSVYILDIMNIDLHH